MSVAPPTCPYCNARLAPAPGPRQLCASCGETVVGRRPSPEAVQPPPAVAPAAPRPADTPRRNRRVLAVVLLGMVAVAGAGLVMALSTVADRRAHDKSLPRRIRRPYQLFVDPTPEPTEVVSPARLAALGYLPPRTNLVVAAHVAELLASPAGTALRGQSLAVGRFELGLDAWRKWTGLDAEEIDHLAVGAVIDPGESPRLYCVVRTLRARDPARLRAALGAGRRTEERTPAGGTRMVHQTAVPVPGALWQADALTFVLGLGVDKLAEVPARPRDGVTGLSDEVTAAVKTRVGAGAPLWAVGHSPDWGKTILPPLAGKAGGVPGLARLDRVRTFALWVRPERPVVLHGALRCADADAASRLAAEELAGRARARPGTFRYDVNGEWIGFQWTTAVGAEGGAP